MTTKKIALFIDADNISAKFGRQIIETLEKRGEIFIRRIYGNWEKNILHGWNECILNFSLRPVQQHDFTAGKNATDMSLTIDAMDVFYGGKAEIFALVSNDSDFTPLAIRLREGGMNILGIGNSHASNSFRSACNEFIDLDAAIKPEHKKISAPQNPPMQMLLFDDDDKIVALTPEPEKSPAPVKKSPAPVKNSPAPVKKSPAPVKNSKVVPISERSDADKKIQQIHSILRTAAKTKGDNKGFVDLSCAGQTLHDKNLTIKGSGHSTLRKFVAAFPNLYEVRAVGKNVSYRCR